jgi:hypothetical protein
MKIFLGVLETDILRVDVGLSQLDPRRLACGEREDVVFIAELLCWVGRRMKLIKTKKITAPGDVLLSPSRSRDPQASTFILSPTNQRTRWESSPTCSKPPQLDIDAASTFQSAWTDYSTPLNNSPFTTRPFDDESFTSFNTDDHPLLQPPFEPKTTEANPKEITDDDALSSVSDILGGLSGTLNLRHREQPRCIHEIPTPPFVPISPSKLPSTPPRNSPSNFSRNWCPEHSKDLCMCNVFGSPQRSPSVRYSGYIEPVDEDSEIASFELSRSISTTPEQSLDVLVQVDLPFVFLFYKY